MFKAGVEKDTDKIVKDEQIKGSIDDEQEDLIEAKK